MKPKKIKLYRPSSFCWAVGYRGRSYSWEYGENHPRREWDFDGIITRRVSVSVSWNIGYIYSPAKNWR